MAEQNSWDKFAQWTRMGNNRRGVNEMKDETMQGTTTEQMEMDQTVQQEPEIVTGEGVPQDAAAAQNVAQTELAQVRGERDQLLDRLARLQAEFDNARKREAKERADNREYTISSTVEPFLGVMDNFQLALKADGTAEQLRSGVELILKQMEEALRGLNVQAVETVGRPFDPRIHEALGSIETSEFPDHQVLEEIRRGYKIREKLLRPALVRIASNTAQMAE